VRSIFEDQRLTLADGVRRLESLGLNYMLTGSVAMLRFAPGRMTNDIDIVVQLEHRDRLRFVDAFAGNYYIPEEKIAGAIDRSSMFNVLNNETLVKIDIALVKPTEFHKNAFENRERVDLWDIEVWAIRRDDLIVSKLFWAKDSRSERQLRDVVTVMMNGFDADYILSWVKALGVSDLFDICVAEWERINV
jgi:hypothetical protein